MRNPLVRFTGKFGVDDYFYPVFITRELTNNAFVKLSIKNVTDGIFDKCSTNAYINFYRYVY